MRHGGRSGEEGPPPFLVGGHARGDFVQLVETLNPEALVNVDVPAVALRALAVVAQEVQGSLPLRRIEHQRVALQIYVELLFRQRDDV